MSEKLIQLLNLMDFKESRRPGMFKIPDKKLFHQIFCFLVDKIEGLPEKEKFLTGHCGLISNMSSTQATAYKTSIMNLISKINAAYPEFPVKPIGQSYIKVPQGDRVIVFLTELCRTALFSISKSLGETYVEPTNCNEIDEFLKDHGCSASPNELTELLENKKKYKATLCSQSQLEIEQLKADFSQLVDSSCLDSAMKNKLNSINENESQAGLEELKHNVQTQINTIQFEFEEYKKTEQNLQSLNCNLVKIQELKKFSVDVGNALKEIGEGSVSDETGNLESLFKSAVEKTTLLKEAISFDKVMDNHNRVVGLIDLLDEKCTDLNCKIQDAKETHDTLKPLVKAKLEEYKNELAKSDDPLDEELMEYLNTDFNFDLEPDENIEIPMPEYELPVPPCQLAQFIVGDSCSRPVSIKKSAAKSFGRTPKLSKMLAAKKLDMCKATASNIPYKMSLQPLIGIGHNRRETIASPVAHRERVKSKHIDARREPLKATKLLFPPTSSSPISELKEVLSFGDESVISNPADFLYRATPFTSTQMNMNLSDMGTGCDFNEMEKSLDVSKDILLWNQSTSDESDLDLAVALPVSANNEDNTIMSDASSPQLDNNQHNSRDDLIERFLELKNSISKQN